MKRFITLILMLTTLLTFTQKVTAFAPLSESGMMSMVNCPILMVSNESVNEHCKTGCDSDEIHHNSDCQASCDLMMMVSVLYFNEHGHSVHQHELQLTYQISDSAAPYYLPESLYRPPFIS
jgi:hypothetical protein